MPVANLIPQIWSARLAANMDKALVLAPLANTNYEGEIAGIGSVLKLQKAANLTIGTYTGAAITYEAPTSTTTSLTVNQDRFFAFTVDDLARVQANVDLVDSFTRRAGYGLADALDGALRLPHPLRALRLARGAIGHAPLPVQHRLRGRRRAEFVLSTRLSRTAVRGYAPGTCGFRKHTRTMRHARPQSAVLSKATRP